MVVTIPRPAHPGSSGAGGGLVQEGRLELLVPRPGRVLAADGDPLAVADRREAGVGGQVVTYGGEAGAVADFEQGSGAVRT